MKFTATSILRSGTSVALCLAALTAQAEDLRFWTTEEQPERLARQEAMAEAFAQATGHSVQVIPVTENDLRYLPGISY